MCVGYGGRGCINKDIKVGQYSGNMVSMSFSITQTRLCNIQQYFTAVKTIIFR